MQFVLAVSETVGSGLEGEQNMQAFVVVNRSFV